MAEPSIEVKAPTYTIDIYREVMTGIQTGSYAVLLSLAVVYLLTRRSMGIAWHKHFDHLESLKGSIEANAKSLTIISESNRRIADLMSNPSHVDPESVESIKRELLIAQERLESIIRSKSDE